jgi:hypothetical protein
LIDIIKSIDGQNNSARFFIYDKLEINPVLVFALFITSIMLLSLSDSLIFHLFWGGAIIIISAGIKKLNKLVIKPVISFRIFLLFSFFFSYLTSSDLKISFIFLAKVILLVLLSRWFNYFIDHKSLLKNLDGYFSILKPVFIRKAIRKASFSILLGIEFVSELFTGAKIIRSGRAEAAGSQGTAIIKNNTEILTDLFKFSFVKAVEMEAQYTGKEVDFGNSRTISVAFNKFDAIIVALIMILILFFITTL